MLKKYRFISERNLEIHIISISLSINFEECDERFYIWSDQFDNGFDTYSDNC